MAEQKLFHALNAVRRRLLGISLGCGIAWALVIGVSVLIACAWADLALDLPPALRLTCSLLAIGCGVVLLVWAVLGAVRHSTQAALARRLDDVANSGGQILSGVDLSQQFSGGGGSSAAIAPAGGLSGALARIAIERAAAMAGKVQSRSAVPYKPLTMPMVSLGILAFALGLVGLIAPRLFATQLARFADPFGDHPPYSAITFEVQPGDTTVRYGSALDVRAKTEGGSVDQLDLVLVSAAAPEEVLPMFPEPAGSWRATVADVTAAGRYFVRTRGARSRQFSFGLITVPELKDVKFRVTPPSYTRRPAYEGPLPQNGLAGLPGTKVELWARSNRPLSGGSLTFTPAADDRAATRSATSTIALSPIAANAAEASGSFVINHAGTIELKVTDVAGESSKDTFTASVGLLHDDRPFVRMVEPKPNSFATPDVSLPVAVLAEDDYGITRVQIFRSLNDSRPLGVDVPVPQEPTTRLPATLSLPLSQYGLAPGDVIKLFARVEDNDPAGAKGSESSIVTVQIISREDLNRLTLAREGMEVLQSKYEEARRRLEALNEEINKLEKELKELDPNSALAKEKQQKMRDLADAVADAADAIQRNAEEDLPFDLDANLRAKLQELSDEVRKAGKEFEKKAKKPGGVPSVAVAGEILRELKECLGGGDAKFKEEVTEPIEHLAKIFPLKEDEAQFADLYLRQRDLAERMSALKAQAGDDPGSKARMRDLENEQRQLREELRDLLMNIDNHVEALPADPKLDKLREMTRKFATEVRASLAGEQMQSAETALSEFTGAEAAKFAKEASDTLEKFIAQCNGMGGEASACLKFQPTLSKGLGSTVEQLLAAQGLGMKPGMGMGTGGGYSARRSTLNNVGLYGSLPRMSRSSKAGHGRDSQGAATGADGSPTDPNDPDALRAGGRLQAAGESGANVPAAYRTKVGEYFQRVSDELGE